MATDYDAPRKNDEENEDSIEELKSRRNDKNSGKVDEDSVICKFCGIVPCTHHCRRFRYDPLKRIPPRRAALPEKGEQDYSL